MTKPRVGFLRLGLMGSGMTRRLIAAGSPVSVYNRNRDKAAPQVAAGARLADTPREAAQNTDVIISMVADAARRGLARKRGRARRRARGEGTSPFSKRPSPAVGRTRPRVN
jgi:3-hydroxyisobutyrate dehydrogenase-like beta-hydroxyacid dehydrogenase